MSYEFMTIDRDGPVAIVTLSRPEKLNAISQATHREMLRVCDELREDDSVRSIIWTGAGRGFCSGADLTAGPREERTPTHREQLDEYSWVGRQAIGVYRLDKPTIAAVNGVAAGAGMSLALACDIRVGSPNTRFKVVFIERGLSPDSGLSYFLPRIVGYSRACDLVYTSRDVNADEAYRIGLLDRLVPAEQLLDEAKALAHQIASWPPLAMRMSKRVMQASQENDLEQHLRYEITAIGFGRKAVNDARESRAAFLEKRKPVYTGT